MKSVKRYCLNSECGSRRTGNTSTHEIYGIQEGQETPFGKMADMVKLRCVCCKHESTDIISKRKPRKQVGKFYHEGLGQVFDDKDHEKKWTKENGYDPV
jgi:hypothetical protein